MLKFIKKVLYYRTIWWLIAITALFLEMIALFLQYIIGLRPCVLCIYERCALFGIMGAGFLGAVTSKMLLRYIAIAIWIYSAWEGIILSWTHNKIRFYPSPLLTCELVARFPDWMPLGKWLPEVFAASGDCAVDNWKFLNLEIQQWLLGIFFIYFFIALIILCYRIISI